MLRDYIAHTKPLRQRIEARIFTGETQGLLIARVLMPNLPNADADTLESTSERYTAATESRHQTLAYLSRYLFWLVMAVLLGAFSLVV